MKDDEVLIYADESSTYRVKPTGGRSYQRIKRPKKIPARWQTKGKVEIIASYDIRNKKIIPCFNRSKKIVDFKKFIKRIFLRYQHYRKVFMVLDNFKTHKAKDLIKWLRIENHLRKKQKKTVIQILYLPTYSPWLSPIEPIFGIMIRMVIKNSDYQSEKEMIQAIRTFFRNRNLNQKKTSNK